MAWSGYLDRYGFTQEQKVQWWKLRSKWLKYNPLCKFCSEPGNVVDHIQPHRGDVKLFLKLTNLQTLCKKCHDGKKQLIESNSHKREVGEDGFYKD
jgi:5-methylcytosine-specific restriction endonuclease McrA